MPARILQLGTPTELYARPANVKVAQFIGSPAINLLPAKVGDGGASSVLGRRLPLRTALRRGHRRHASASGPRRSRRAGTRRCATGRSRSPRVLRRAENLGSEYILHFDVAGIGDRRDHVPRARPITIRRRAAHVELVFDAAACHVFDAEGRAHRAARCRRSGDRHAAGAARTSARGGTAR